MVPVIEILIILQLQYMIEPIGAGSSDPDKTWIDFWGLTHWPLGNLNEILDM